MTACWPRASALAAAVGIATGRGGRDGAGGAAGGAVDDDDDELLEELLNEEELLLDELELELLEELLGDDELLDGCDCCCRGRRTNWMTTGRADSRIIVITASFGLPTTFTPATLYMASPMAI